MKPQVEYTNDKILIHHENGTLEMNKSGSPETDDRNLAGNLAMIESYYLYRSDTFASDFNKHLETVILATRGGGTGARACRDALLSLYNGAFKANLTDWYNLDDTNKKALLFVLEHQTSNNRKDVDLYLPQYQADFTRMRNEVADDEER